MSNSSEKADAASTAGIGRLWAGKLYGTNTGNLSAELASEGTKVAGIIRFMDDRFGLVVYAAKGSFDGRVFEVQGVATQSPQGVDNGTVTVKGALTPEGQLRGQWTSTIGTGGTFVLFPHDAPEADKNPTPTGSLPERIHTATRSIGAVRLYADDVKALIGYLARDFASGGRVIVTYVERGNEISMYASDFEAGMSQLGELRYLKLQIREVEAYGINRLVSVELNADGKNEVRVQGVQESWTVGKAEAVAAQLRRGQKTVVTTARRFGLNINSLLFVGTLGVLPDLPVWRRAIFVALIVLVTWTVAQLHRRFIPNALLHLSDRKPGSLERAWPQILSWVIAASAGLVSLIAYSLLRGEFPWLVPG